MSVVGRVDLLESDIIEMTVVIPHDDPLVLHRIRNRKRLEDTRGCSQHAVLVGLDAVLDLQLPVGLCDKARKCYPGVFLLSFPAAE